MSWLHQTTTSDDPRPSAGQPIVQVVNVSKTFGVVKALRNVSIEVREGDFVGLAGENGAGKSTLLSVISGLIRPDSGSVTLRGSTDAADRAYDFHRANLAGIFRIYQEQALLPNLRVYENMYLGHESLFSRHGVINRGKMRSLTEAHMERFVGRGIDPNALIRDLSWGERQFVEIVRAFAVASLLEIEAPLMLLDEPTAAMTHDDLESFYALLRSLRTVESFARASFVLVSHRLDEVLELSDRVYVMKDGEVIAEVPEPKTVDERDLHALMVGRSREANYYCEERQRESFGDVVLALEGSSVDRSFENVSFEVRAGEIVGVGGVTGSGKSEVGRAIAGLTKLTSGGLRILGRDVGRTSIGKRVGLGVGYVPLDRHSEGLILYLPISHNITLSALDDVASRWRFLLARTRERHVATDAMRRFAIRAGSCQMKPSELSGGNQQKVVMARSLVAGSKVLVLDHPTRGVDAGAKYEIYSLLRDLADRGVAIVMISDELPELIGMSNRVIVMRGGVVTHEAAAPASSKPSEESIVQALV
jgi:ribose transport system ATP-binding protein